MFRKVLGDIAKRETLLKATKEMKLGRDMIAHLLKWHGTLKKKNSVITYMKSTHFFTIAEKS